MVPAPQEGLGLEQPDERELLLAAELLAGAELLLAAAELLLGSCVSHLLLHESLSSVFPSSQFSGDSRIPLPHLPPEELLFAAAEELLAAAEELFAAAEELLAAEELAGAALLEACGPEEDAPPELLLMAAQQQSNTIPPMEQESLTQLNPGIPRQDVDAMHIPGETQAPGALELAGPPAHGFVVEANVPAVQEVPHITGVSIQLLPAE